LKPENLLLSTKTRLDGTIKLIDFGCAVVKAEEDDVGIFGGRKKPLTKSANSTGTTAYWAPERFKRGAICDAHMDMWSVGTLSDCFGQSRPRNVGSLL
jgi:serine/threonine protein kinase